MSWVNDIERYNPYNEQEKKDKEMMLYYINTFENVLTRENEIAHMTSSAFILNKERDKVLMIYHNIYDSWGWTGGHSDGDKDLLAVAIREAREETGIKIANPITTEMFSLDILPVVGHVKNGNYVSAHLHLSVTYLLEADEEEVLIIKEDENSGVKWIHLDRVVDASNEPHMKKVYSKIISKIKLL
jgi:ADP-ribose pyrophosphatase